MTWFVSWRMGRWAREEVADALVIVGGLTLAVRHDHAPRRLRGREATMGYAATAGRVSMAERTRLAVADVVAAGRAFFFLLLVGAGLLFAAALDPRW